MTRLNFIWLRISKAVQTACLVLLMLLLVFGLSGCKGTGEKTDISVSATMAPEVYPSTPTPPEQVEQATIDQPVAAAGTEKPDVEIETPYCTLYYPGEWEAFLKTEQFEGDVHTVTFTAVLESGKTQELFSIVFGKDGANTIGVLKSEVGESVPVSIESVYFVPDDSWSDTEINIVFTMQEALNEVIAAMPLEQPAEADEANIADDPVLPEDNGEEMTVDTLYAELPYPERWEEYLTVKIEDEDIYSVGYFANIGEHDEVHLFTIYFGGEDGMSTETFIQVDGEDVELRLSFGELAFDESWSDDERRIAVAMQEDLNYLLGNLE